MLSRLVLEAKSLKLPNTSCVTSVVQNITISNKCFFIKLLSLGISIYPCFIVCKSLDTLIAQHLGGNGTQLKWIFHFTKYLEPPPLLRTFFKFCVQVERYLTKRPRKWGREACGPRVPFSVLFWAEFRQITTWKIWFRPKQRIFRWKNMAQIRQIFEKKNPNRRIFMIISRR